MADMWRTRDPPIPLDFEKILDGSFILRTPPVSQGSSDASSSQTPSSDAIINGTKLSVNGNYNTASNLAGSNLKDQKRLTLKDNLELFIARFVPRNRVVYFPILLAEHGSSTHLAARLRAGEDTIAFDKDDDNTLDFVTAASNLRSFAYGIESKTRWEVKGTME